ncbi:hypothetical protein [Zoogloea sp. LCSB751]|uniref:hypothetical protein n=1 Tax=Zoogloea sp. LCSB751 TaxID=1965277 RepID=UPI000B496AFE|nr:hypothetical protein [Zoogloea sp. LCSB751]
MEKLLISRGRNWSGFERRSGKDRRQRDRGSPTGYERRHQVEQREIEVTEWFCSEPEWQVLQKKWLH